MSKRIFHIFILIILSLSTVFAIQAQTQDTEDTCSSSVEPVITTDASTVDYTLSEPIVDELGSSTFTINYTVSGTATVDDYGMVYAAARINFREDPTYEWGDIQDLLEVGTIVQACGNEEGDFIEVQLLGESVSVINEYSPDIALEGDTGWIYATFFEPVAFEVSASEEGALELTLTPEELAVFTDPITGEIIDQEGLDAYIDTKVRELITEDLATFEFTAVAIDDEAGATEIETWQEELLTGEGEEWDALREIYLNEEGDLSDATSLDNGGEEEGALENSSSNNGQFEEGRTNEFDCDGYGNSCENRSENAQANGNTNDVNKFGCVGRGNSCNAGNNNSDDDNVNSNSGNNGNGNGNGNSNGNGNGKNKNKGK